MLTHFSISQQGKRHIEKDVPCQDFSASKRIDVERFGCEIVIAAVADGVGSCEFSQFGSETAVQSFLNCVEHNIQNKLADLSDDNIINLIKHAFNYALSQVDKEAEERELPFLEFDTTLTGIVYDGHTLWFGHIGDDGVVVLYSDGEYEMITQRHKGEEIHSVIPLREYDVWQFGKSSKEVASCVLMTDGVLDHCVDTESMGNRVYFPFLEPALTEAALTDEDAEKQRLDWDEYFAGKGDYPENIRDTVTDDISFVVVQNPDLVKNMDPVQFDFDKWDEDTAKRKKELNDALYADYRSYKEGTYQGAVKQAARCSPKGAAADPTNSREKKGVHSTGQSIKNDEAAPDQNKDGDNTELEDLYAETAEALVSVGYNAGKDLRKTMEFVSKIVKNQLAPKGKQKKGRNMPAKEQTGTDHGEGPEIDHTVNCSPDEQHKVPPQDTKADGED